MSNSPRRMMGLLVVSRAASLLLLVTAGALRAQTSDCQIDLRAGSRQAPEKLPVADGSPVSPMKNGGVSLGLGGSCIVMGGLRLGPAAEAHFGEEISFYNLLAAVQLPVVRAGRLVLSVGGAGGWALSGHGTGASILLPPRDALVLEPGDTSGPVVGTDLRLGLPLVDRFRVVVNAGWRAMFLERIWYGTYRPGSIGGPRLGTEPETVHLFPLTAGLTVVL